MTRFRKKCWRIWASYRCMALSYLPRSYADILKGLRCKNMKELHIQFSGPPIRTVYAFDPIRRAIVPCNGGKGNDKRFYEKLIRIAEDEFAAYLKNLEIKK